MEAQESHPAQFEDQQRRRRRFRRLSLLAWAIFWLWFARFAYVRYTTPPAIAARPGAIAALHRNPEDQRLDDAVYEVGTHPAWNTYYQTGFTPFESALRRPIEELKASADPVYSAITDPQLLAALADLQKNVAIHSAAAQPGQPVGSGTRPFWWERWDSTASAALVLQARVDRAAGSPLDAAISKLCDAYYVAKRGDTRAADSDARLFGSPAALIPLDAIALLALDEPLSLDEARRLIEAVSAGGLRLSDALLGAGLNGDIESALDRYYTDDGNGDGWLVLSAAASARWTAPFSDRLSDSPMWNIFSPFFHGRREIRARMTTTFKLLESLDNSDLKTSADTLLQAADLPRTILDGPFFHMTQRLNSETLRTAVDIVQRRRATVLLLALSAYRTDHGAYPESLAALRPAYLEQIPLDAETSAPFQYRVADDGQIELGRDRTSHQLDEEPQPLVPRRTKRLRGAAP